MIRLFELRTEKNLSQRALATMLNISQGTYNNWENGRTQPSIEQLVTLSELFSVSVDYLIGNTDEIDTMRMDSMLSKEETEVIQKYRSLTAETKLSLLNLLKQLR
jgi:transcriptional regulator with XRE-family HTH domain